ncbi:MAG: SpoIIE family protein phosphatase [Polyangiaceae bacterium]|nr:SpoIIE family protein phosphatase [Polyangiaceae bacterium]
MRVVIGSTTLAKRGETTCGDFCATFPTSLGTLLCLADGLGHGEKARVAAERACAYVGANADTPLEPLLRGLDRALAGSRGAAVSLVALQPEARRMQFAGIGNVELRALATTRIAPPTMPGIVGQGFRTVKVWDYTIAPGDLLVLTSDGVSSRFDLESLGHLTPQQVAEAIVTDHHKSHDDACALVARLEV